jgi:hypothetical protein
MRRQASTLFTLTFVSVVALAVSGMAQGMMGRGGRMGTEIGGMGGEAMGMASGAVTVGTDGALYVLSRVPSTSTNVQGNTSKTRLSALDGKRGTSLWSIVLGEYWLSRPVEGPDGRLFLVTFGQGGNMEGMFGGTASEVTDAKLYIVDTATQKVVKIVTLDAEIASVPTIGGTDLNYTVHVVTFDMDHDFDTRGQVGREATLYAFDRDGNLKFSIPLDR